MQKKNKKRGATLFFYCPKSYIIIVVLLCECTFTGQGVMFLEYTDNQADWTENAPQGSAAQKARAGRSLVLAYLHDLVCLIAGVLLVFSLCFRVVVVSGPSMNNTLYDGDWLFVLSNVLYAEPKQGDIIVASKDSFDNGAPIIKRVIATEGQKVDVDFNAGIVYVDDVALDEPYVLTSTTLYEGVEFPLTVDDGCIFVMGDNRDNSKDSRSPEIGQIDCREVLGKAVFLFLPGTNKGQVTRQFSRIGVLS